jgi:hypothetical protein
MFSQWLSLQILDLQALPKKIFQLLAQKPKLEKKLYLFKQILS